MNKKSANIIIKSTKTNQHESLLYTVLIQGLAKGDRMDIVIQKAVELGVNEIFPISTEYTAVKLDSNRKLKKFRHWQSIIHSACEQCERAIIPILHPIQSLEEAIKSCKTQKNFSAPL